MPGLRPPPRPAGEGPAPGGRAGLPLRGGPLLRRARADRRAGHEIPGQILADEGVRPVYRPGFDAVTYVPVSPRRRFVRGYDQAQLLAREAAGIWGVRAERTLRKVRHNRAQSSLSSPRERQENVKNAYAVPRPGQVAGRRFLLIDDVCTTGGTMAACADALTAAGAASVVCAALAGGHGANIPE